MPGSKLVRRPPFHDAVRQYANPEESMVSAFARRLLGSLFEDNLRFELLVMNDDLYCSGRRATHATELEAVS